MKISAKKIFLPRLKNLLSGIGKKFLLYFFAFSIVPIVVISVIGYQLTQEIIIRHNFNYLLIQNELVRSRFTAFMLGTGQLISPYNPNNFYYFQKIEQALKAKSPSEGTPAEVFDFLNRLVGDAHRFAGLWILDRDYRLRMSATGDPLPIPVDLLKYRADAPFVSSRSTPENLNQSIFCVHPLRDENLEVYGFLVGMVNQDALMKVLTDVIQGYPTARIFLFRERGDVLFCTNPGTGLPPTFEVSKAAGFGSPEIVRLDDGRRVIRHKAPLGILDWYILSEIDYADAMRDVLRFRNQAIAGVSLLMLLLIFLAVYVSRYFSRPIRELVAAAQKIGEGKLDTTINRDLPDEIGLLARELEEMRRKLKDYYENLEKRVNERTEELRRAQFQIMHQEKMASIGLLAAGIAHEIGNPLTSISSITQILKRRLKDPENRQNLAIIMENIERISRIVRELVDFSRPPMDDPRLTNINEVIRAAVGIVRYDRRAKNIRFHVELDENLPYLEIVPDQLQQVLFNLLFNAMDAMENAGEDLFVRSRQMNGQAIIEIKDTGVGIPPDKIGKIFEPFYTTKEVGRGTGLGLSVSYSIIKKWNGDIQVESEPGKGSTFRIVLPLDINEKKEAV